MQTHTHIYIHTYIYIYIIDSIAWGGTFSPMRSWAEGRLRGSKLVRSRTSSWASLGAFFSKSTGSLSPFDEWGKGE